jgi:hypothetical protein
MGRFAKIFSESVPIIGISELKEKLAQGNQPYLLDVRQAVEYRTGHAASATLIPLGELGSRLNEAPKDREVVCICASDPPASRGWICRQKPEERDDRLAAGKTPDQDGNIGIGCNGDATGKRR